MGVRRYVSTSRGTVSSRGQSGWCRIETMPFRGLPWYCPWVLFFAGTDAPTKVFERKESTVCQVTASDAAFRVSNRLLSTTFALARPVPEDSWHGPYFLRPRTPGHRRPAPDGGRGTPDPGRRSFAAGRVQTSFHVEQGASVLGRLLARSLPKLALTYPYPE